MISTSESKNNNKGKVLEQLKSTRERINRTQGALSSASKMPEPSSQPPFVMPPAQSRDATLSSRFFPNTPPLGNVLVPNSSPIAPEEAESKPYRPYSAPLSRDLSSSSSSTYANGWAQSVPSFPFDPLNASSGFISRGGSSHATLRRQYSKEDSGNHEEGPPRKRINRGSSIDAFAVPQSPPSSEIHRVERKRHATSMSMDTTSLSSDDSLPSPSQVLAGPSKPRLTKSRPSPVRDLHPTSDLSSDKAFQLFQFENPEHNYQRKKAAWTRANGDKNKATFFLNDSSWQPLPSPSPVSGSKESIGRVKELEDASKAQRASVKEKGKKSLIYANRTTLETKSPSTPPPARPIIDLTSPTPAPAPASPSTPLIKQLPRKRVKKLVIDSDSDSAFDGESKEEEREKSEPLSSTFESRALEYINSSEADALQELTGCTSEQAQAIIGLRPFLSPEDVRTRLGTGKKKAGSSGISSRMFDDCVDMLKEYGVVDNVLESCERIGAKLRSSIASWAPSKKSIIEDNAEEGALSLTSVIAKNSKPKNYLTSQPKLLANGVTLKEYQLLGVNWLNLLYSSHLSCILADEMGLGKTIQVISFLSYLKEQGKKGPHLIVVPSSTLENWCREFAKFAPSIAIQTYYADKNERPLLRETLLDTQRCKSKGSDGWEVLITTYNLAQGDDRDRKFFRRIDWDCCVYDEGHVLKNFQSQRYQSLLKFGSNWRLLLTGTPLQNNLQELVSLLNFILPEQFAGSIGSLRAIFKVRGDTKISLLSQERISRAKTMMTPFVLRRRKDQVLKDLPKKTERIEWCDMTELQRTIYHDTLNRSRKTIVEAALDDDETVTTKPSKKKAAARPKDKLYAENSSNVLMDLRKAASHPMLFRKLFTDESLTGITKQLLKEPDFRKRGALFELVKEDMSVMTDSELQVFCATYKSTRKYLQDKDCYIDAGKVQVLLKLVEDYRNQGRKILIFSQFTQILDILQAVLRNRNIKFLVLTGSTPVDVRQTLVDEFTEDDSIPVFLLSTKAGGMGINLTAASVVIMFDQDFNPHNDRQAQDRAYRIGQKRDVDVVKLISKGTIEEDMLRLGETKLALDEAVAGDADDKDGSAPERALKTSLLKTLRQQFIQSEQQPETPLKSS